MQDRKNTIGPDSFRQWVLCLLLQVSVLFSFSQDLDSLVTIQNTPFFSSFLSKPQVEASIFVQHRYINTSFKHPILVYKDFHVIKNRKGVFLCLTGTSRVYRMYQKNDSLLHFRRIDNFIENINYNINALFFSHQGQLYNYAGYGFWKTNGLLRKFNEISREWDIVPVSKEVHNIFDVEHSWKAPQSDKLYIFYEQILNEGINDQAKNIRINADAYAINLNSGQVQELGNISPFLVETIVNTKRLIQTPDGVILLRSPFGYYLKPKENRYYTITDNTIIQALERSDRNGLYYYDSGKVYFTNVNYTKFDSLSVLNLPLKKVGRIWVHPAERYSIISGVGLLVIGIVLGLFVYLKKRREKQKPPLPKPMAPLIPVPVLSETEVALLQMLIKKTLDGTYASSNDINYIIGCKDKNIGLQKKMRSDMINGINAKYKLFSKQEAPLIESQRTEADKRYFQYTIHYDCFQDAQQFVEMTRVQSNS